MAAAARYPADPVAQRRTRTELAGSGNLSVRVLITGASGQVGGALRRSCPANTEVRALTRAELDIGDSAAVDAALAAWRPEVVINAAAYTAVDRAEEEPELAAAINARGP